MITDTDLSLLQPWLTFDMSPVSVAGLVAHPAFTEAARALNRVKVQAVAHPVMGMLSRDAGHYVAALLTLSLHRSGGITMPRLKKACAESRFMSPGRARSMLGYLQHIGCLSRASPHRGADAAVYVPTDRFVEAWFDRLRRGLECLVVIEPAVRHVLDGMDDPEVAFTFAQIRGESVLAGLARAGGHDLPFVRIFNHRLGGGRALALLLSRDESNGPLASASIPWSLDDVVRMCGISRVQAKRLFHEASAEGLVHLQDGRLTWLEGARQFIVYSCAFEFASMLASAAATVAALPKAFPIDSLSVRHPEADIPGNLTRG